MNDDLGEGLDRRLIAFGGEAGDGGDGLALFLFRFATMPLTALSPGALGPFAANRGPRTSELPVAAPHARDNGDVAVIGGVSRPGEELREPFGGEGLPVRKIDALGRRM
jgi:hypothetical protein